MEHEAKRWNRRSGVRCAAVAALFLALAVAGSAGTITLGTYSVDPKSSYLLAGSDAPGTPLFIDLTSLGVTPGQSLVITASGDLCFFAGPECGELPAYLGGVFTNSNTWNGNGNANDPSGPNANTAVNRLMGALSSGAPGVADPNTWFGNHSTDIPQDFQILLFPGLGVTAPNPGEGHDLFLVVGVLDSYYTDNSDPNHDLSVQVALDPPDNPSAVPEPGTSSLFVTGLGGLLALFRKKLS